MPSTQPIGLLARMRIRKKLIFLHTCFSLGLAAVLVIASRPAVNEIVNQSERSEAMLWMKMIEAALDEGYEGRSATNQVEEVLERIDVRHVRIGVSDLDQAPFLQPDLHELQTEPGRATPIRDREGRACAALLDDGRVYTVHTTLQGARKGVRQL
ncbi:MAG: hypothetical protein KDA28_09190, partial [Phycisphaerales bacterium]|nr:hypothetical protein [Phycisphaerales bacterium]